MTKEEWEDYCADRCYECTGYGDDWYIDGNGEPVNACNDCPYSKEFEKNDQTGSGRGA